MARVTARRYLQNTGTSYIGTTLIGTPVARDMHRTMFIFNDVIPQAKKIVGVLISFKISCAPNSVFPITATFPLCLYTNSEEMPDYIVKELDEAGISYANYQRLSYDITNDIDLNSLKSGTIGVGGIAAGGEANDYLLYLLSNFAPNLDDRPFIDIICADAPDLPTDLSPSAGANVEITGGNGHFAWKHNPSTISGLPQKSYNIQFSADGVTWTTVSATTSNQYADVATASIPSGNFYWRVQVIDTDDVPSDYSAAQYAYRGTMPAAPSIITSVFDSSKPRIEWSTAYTQAGYRVQILLGEVSVIDATVETADAFYDVPVALADDTQYTVRVTVKDESAHYSAWAEDSISTDYAVPEVPTFILTKKKDSVELNITNPTGEAVIRNDIYRLEGTEHIRIGSTTGTTYTDWSVGTGIQTYKVAAVGASGEAMSTAAEVDFAVVGTYLTAVDDTEHPFKVKYNVLDKNSAEHNMTLVEYAGREKPVAEFGEVIQRSVYVSFDSDDAGEYARLHDILSSQSVVLFRNAREKIYGVCTNLTDQPQNYQKTAYNLSFVVNEIEHSEVV
jgi:hypothetical protein